MNSALDQFRVSLTEFGLTPPTEIIADGKIHRCVSNGKRGDDAGWYVVHLDGIPAGAFGDWRAGTTANWRANIGRRLTLAEESEHRGRVAVFKREREREDQQLKAQARSKAESIWANAIPVTNHPYLDRKRIAAHGTRVHEGKLVIPMRDGDQIHSLQMIDPDGMKKRFLADGRTKGCYYSIGGKPDHTLCIAEGFATAASIFAATGHAVAVAFYSGNLATVAGVMRAKFPETRLILCADDDAATAGNPGMSKATEAACSTGGLLAVPSFGEGRPPGVSDFNDLAYLKGLNVVRSQIEAAVKVSSSKVQGDVDVGKAGLVCAASIRPEPVKWLWHEWLAGGKFHVLAGAPGTGKTTVALAMAAAVSTAGCWPDRSRAPRGDVLIWSAEDDPADTLIPRLMAMGADLNRIHFIQTAIDDRGVRAFDPATDIPRLRATVSNSPSKPLVLVVDPIVSAVAGDSHKSSETRRSLQPLVDFAAEVGCALIGISHFSKGTQGRDVVERVTGSLAFGAFARLVFAAAKMPDDKGGGRFIARAKSNLGPDGGGFNYELRQETLASRPDISASTLLWGEAIEGNARDILAQAEAAEDPDTKSQTSEAEDWLRDLLNFDAVKAVDVIKKATAAGISQKSLRAARERLGVKPRKTAYTGGWVWALPHVQDAQSSQDAQGAQPLSVGILGTFDGPGHLGNGKGVHDAEVF